MLGCNVAHDRSFPCSRCGNLPQLCWATYGFQSKPAYLDLQAAAAAEQRKLEDVKRRALEQRDIQQQQLEDLKRRILAERYDGNRGLAC